MRSVLVFAVVLFASVCLAESPHKMMFRDYTVTEVQKVGAFSVGVVSWSDSDGFTIGCYGDVKVIMLWDEKLNFGGGTVVKPSREHKVDLRLEVSASTHWFDCLELGVWYAPFWGLMGNDDPYGLLAGYYFKF